MTGSPTVAVLTARVDAWWPKGLPAEGLVPAEVALARTVVVAAKPRGWTEAGTACLYTYRYATWRVSEGLELDPATMFAKDDVDAYGRVLLAEGCPRGSAVAVQSFLRRMAPGEGFASTVRRTATPRPAPTGAEPVQVAAGLLVDITGPLSDDVEAVLSTYMPETLEPDRWAVVAEPVRAIVRRGAPRVASSAEHLVMVVGYLAAWADLHHRPLRPDVLLAGPTIETFLGVLAGAKVPTSSLASYASGLHGLRAVHGIDLVGDRRRWGVRPAAMPYAPEEVARIYDRAGCLNTVRGRRFAHAACKLILRTGGTGVEAGWARPEDITDPTPGHAVVVLRRPSTYSFDEVALALGLPPTAPPMVERHVDVYGVAADELVAVRDAAVTAGDRWLLGGGDRTNTRRTRSTSVLRASSDHGFHVGLEMKRARATWVVEAAASGDYPTVVEFLDAAGVETLEPVVGLLPHIRVRRAQLIAVGVTT